MGRIVSRKGTGHELGSDGGRVEATQGESRAPLGEDDERRAGCHRRQVRGTRGKAAGEIRHCQRGGGSTGQGLHEDHRTTQEV